MNGIGIYIYELRPANEKGEWHSCENYGSHKRFIECVISAVLGWVEVINLYTCRCVCCIEI